MSLIALSQNSCFSILRTVIIIKTKCFGAPSSAASFIRTLSNYNYLNNFNVFKSWKNYFSYKFWHIAHV